MKLLATLAAAGLAVTTLVPVAPAVARPPAARHGWHHGNNWHHRRRRVCRTVWQHHHRVRRCYWR